MYICTIINVHKSFLRTTCVASYVAMCNNNMTILVALQLLSIM